MKEDFFIKAEEKQERKENRRLIKLLKAQRCLYKIVEDKTITALRKLLLDDCDYISRCFSSKNSEAVIALIKEKLNQSTTSKA